MLDISATVKDARKPMKQLKKTLFLFLALLFLGTACQTKKVSEKDARMAKGYFEMAVAYMQGGDATGALGELLKAVEYNPHDPEIRNALGLVYYSKGKYAKAIEQFKIALDLSPDHSDTHHNLGHLYMTQGRYDPAIQEFQAALGNDLYRNRAQTLNAMGFAYYKKRDYLKAEEVLKDCLDHDRLYILAYDNLAKVYIALDRFEEAQGYLESVLKLQPFFPEAMLDLALVYMKLGVREQARDLLKRVKEIDPLGEYGRRADEMLEMLQ